MRIEGWEAKLARHIEDARALEFAWGSNDCVLWCARWIKTATGKDLLAGISLSYGTHEAAVTTLSALGYASTTELARAYLPAISPMLAQRGDIVLFPDNATLGICAGRKGYFLTEKGVTAVDTLKCPKAWKVE